MGIKVNELKKKKTIHFSFFISFPSAIQTNEIEMHYSLFFPPSLSISKHK